MAVKSQTTRERAILVANLGTDGEDLIAERITNQGGAKKRVCRNWTREEDMVLLDCYFQVKDNNNKRSGYMKKLKDLWDQCGPTSRTQPSLVNRVKTILNGNKYSKIELLEIERDSKRKQERREGVRVEDNEFEPLATVVEDVNEETASDNDLDMQIEDESGIGVIDNSKVNIIRIDTCMGNDGLEVISEDDEIILTCLRKVFVSDETYEVPTLKYYSDKRKLKTVTQKINSHIHNVIPANATISDINKLYYTGRVVVTELLGVTNKNKKKGKRKDPAWMRRIQLNIEKWRANLSRIDEIRRGVNIKESIRKDLEKKYQLSEKGTLSVRTLLQNKIDSGAKKIKFYKDSQNSIRHNNLFSNNQSMLYKELNGQLNQDQESPDSKESTTFWSSIWSESKTHNKEAGWLEIIKDKLSKINRQEDITINLDNIKGRINKLSSWKAPGPDNVQGYWIKNFTSLHQVTKTCLQKCLDDGNVPEWMVKGRTVLIQKDTAKGNVASNYRPITCLPIMWKIFSGIFADKINLHLLNNNCLPCEQKGGRKHTRGTKDHSACGQDNNEGSKEQGRRGFPWHGWTIRKPMIWCLILGLLEILGKCIRQLQRIH